MNHHTEIEEAMNKAHECMQTLRRIFPNTLPIDNDTLVTREQVIQILGMSLPPDQLEALTHVTVREIWGILMRIHNRLASQHPDWAVVYLKEERQ